MSVERQFVFRFLHKGVGKDGFCLETMFNILRNQGSLAFKSPCDSLVTTKWSTCSPACAQHIKDQTKIATKRKVPWGIDGKTLEYEPNCCLTTYYDDIMAFTVIYLLPICQFARSIRYRSPYCERRARTLPQLMACFTLQFGGKHSDAAITSKLGSGCDKGSLPCTSVSEVCEPASRHTSCEPASRHTSCFWAYSPCFTCRAKSVQWVQFDCRHTL